MKNVQKILIVTVLMVAGLLASKPLRAQQIAIKANAAAWALCTPDLGLAFVTGEHTSFEISAFGHYKPYGMNSKLLVIQPEFRYWFNGRPLTREFVGVSAFATTYDMTAKGHVYNGDAIALGVIGGYVFNLSKRWNVELSAGFGLLAFRQKQYYVNDNYDDYFVDETSRVNSWGYKLFPVKFGVTFSYIVK